MLLEAQSTVAQKVRILNKPIWIGNDEEKNDQKHYILQGSGMCLQYFSILLHDLYLKRNSRLTYSA
jgi:hypothetical protein